MSQISQRQAQNQKTRDRAARNIDEHRGDSPGETFANRLRTR